MSEFLFLSPHTTLQLVRNIARYTFHHKSLAVIPLQQTKALQCREELFYNGYKNILYDSKIRQVLKEQD